MKRYELYAAMLPRLWLALAFCHIPRPHSNRRPWALPELPWLLVNGIR
jgi:hypothetical protein